MNIKKLIINNLLFKTLYKTKWYFDQGVRQITWITGKLPELMSLVYLSEKMGVAITKVDIIGIAIVGATILIIFGIFIKRTGLYDIEMYVDALKNPVQHEILTAARKINRGDYNEKRK